MARPGGSSSRKNPATRKSSAVAGYAKRHAQRPAFSPQDIYEYTPEKVRRSKIALELDRDEEMGSGAGFGNDDEGGMEIKARLIGENGENEKIDSEDDEEIDSDAAFDEGDDERFAGFFSKKVVKKKRKQPSVRFADVDLNEDDGPAQQGSDHEDEDDEEESGEDEEFIDVLDILDGRGQPLNDDDDPSLRKNFPPEDEQISGEDDEGEDEDDGVSISISEAENEATGALDDLQTFVSSLDPSSSSATKRKADDEEPVQLKKRRTVKERTEAGAESEFRTQSAGLSLNDFLAPLGSSSSLEKSIKLLQSHSGGEGKKKKPQTLSVPLPQRTQERLDREAAYEQTKAEVDKWSATMKRISEADHLSFPLQTQPQGRVSNLELAAKFKPSTALESTISSFLSSANLATDASVLETEENILKTNAVSVEEVAERRRELRRMRELMFRAEVKAKRVKKIKSKVYRRLKRKEKESVSAGAPDDEEIEEKRLKIEMERAKERATLKHKGTGKWAKKMMHRNEYGEAEEDADMRGGRQEIEEMLLRGEKLRRKIQGKESDDDESRSGDEDEDEGGRLESAFDELKALGAVEQGESTESVAKTGKSVFEMKFMKNAMARKQAETDRMVDDFVKEMGGDETRESDGGGKEEPLQDIGVMVSRTGGRMAFKPRQGKEILGNLVRTFSVASEDTSSSTLKSKTEDNISLSPPSPSFPLISTSASQAFPPTSSDSAAPPPSAGNPWLVSLSSTGSDIRVSRKKNEIVVDKDSSQTIKTKHKLKKQSKNTEKEQAKVRDDALVEIEMDEVLVATTNIEADGGEKSTTGKRNAQASSGGASMATEDDSDLDSEIEAQEKMLRTKGKKAKAVKAFEQRELVARAFAGDNVVKDFEEAKRREIAMDAPTEIDTTLPGWGSWGGTGIHKGAPKPHLIKKIAGIDPKSRADYNKSNVIVSEKRDKKAAKYLVNDLPYPYTSKAQFDRRMQQPLGPEWNTRVGFQRGTLPKVVKKMGTIIDPLEKLP